eukprot:357234-Chlamydomonas_euryale.AAC.5
MHAAGVGCRFAHNHSTQTRRTMLHAVKQQQRRCRRYSGVLRMITSVTCRRMPHVDAFAVRGAGAWAVECAEN